MQGCQQVQPPSKLNPQGIGEPVIGVRILREAVSCFFPDGNRIGAEIMCRLLQVRMELAGVHVTEPMHGFQLNASYYQFTVSELATALKAIKEELEKLELVEWSQIAWRDPREDVWRASHSQSGRFDVPSDEEFAIERELLAEIIGIWRLKMSRLKCEESIDR
jgi:hypothetical protein